MQQYVFLFVCLFVFFPLILYNTDTMSSGTPTSPTQNGKRRRSHDIRGACARHTHTLGHKLDGFSLSAVTMCMNLERKKKSRLKILGWLTPQLTLPCCFLLLLNKRSNLFNRKLRPKLQLKQRLCKAEILVSQRQKRWFSSQGRGCGPNGETAGTQTPCGIFLSVLQLQQLDRTLL